MSASRYALNEAFTERIFSRAADALVYLANADGEKLPDTLKAAGLVARRVARILTANNKREPVFDMVVPLPVTFTLKGRAMTWQCDFPTVDEMRQADRDFAASEALEIQGDVTVPDYRARIEEDSRKLVHALNLLVGLCAEERYRRRVKVCALDGCGRYFVRRAARVGDSRKVGRVDFCARHRGAMGRSTPERTEAERANARERQRASREGRAIRGR